MIIGIGETILDIIFRNDQPEAAVPGGSTFNAIISLGRVGMPCTIVTETGNDHVGDIIVAYLKDNGVDTSYVNRHPGTKSHVSLAFLDENNDAHYQFYKDHAHANISSRIPDVTATDVVLFGSYFAVNPVIREHVLTVLRKASDAGSMIYYDINFRASHIDEIPLIIDNLRQNMQMATVVRGSLEDFGYLFGTHDVDEIYETYILPYCPYFICTNGGKPVELRTPEFRTSFPAKPLQTVSTVGAGDNFNAGFIYGTIEHNISRQDIADIDLETWKMLITRGQQFAANVCTSIYNSVSKDFPCLLLQNK